MPAQPSIAIFAQSPAIGDYLAAIVRLAGFIPAGENEAVPITIAASPMTEVPKGQTILALGDGIFAGNASVRVLKTPLRAAHLIEILQREMQAMEAVPAKIVIGKYELDTRDNLWFTPENETVKLTEKEVAILMCLKTADGKSVSRQLLLENVWAYAEGVETHTLETHIYRLRQKIEKDPSSPQILLTDGDGYKLTI